MNHHTKDNILICDSTLREGEQSYGVFFSESTKIEIAKLLSLAGVDIIEIGHLAAASSIEAAGRSICKELPNAIFLAHALPRKGEIELARDVGAKWIGFFLTVDKDLAASKYQTPVIQLLDTVENAIRTAKEMGLSVRFTCEDASRTPQNLLFQAFQRMMTAGADLLGYADTVGRLYPDEFSSVASDLVTAFGTTNLHFHGHNDNGMALANSLVALKAGFRSIDSTVWGIGERMGIVSLTDLVLYLMKGDLLKGFNAKLLGDLETLVASHIDSEKYFSRRFAHKAGLHCASAAREPKTYEPIPAEFLGWKRRFIFSKLSGHQSIEAFWDGSKTPQGAADIDRCFKLLKQMDTEEVSSVGALHALVSRLSEGKTGSVARRVILEESMAIEDGSATLGDLVVAEVTAVGNVSNELELTTGRITTPRVGDVFLGAIGSRRAIAKLIAPVPPEGFEINPIVEFDLLNRGGMIGRAVEQIQGGQLTKVRCLGVIKRDHKNVNLRDYCLPFPSILSQLPPLIVVAGTNMEVGKTELCCGLIGALKRSGLRVCGAKLTGIASLRDILRIKDAGAFEVADFVDGGLVNTLDGKNVRQAAGIVLNYLASFSPDVIVVELGGSVLLGAQALLDYEELRRYFSAVILSAEEVTAAFGAIEALKRFHNLTTDAIGGPVSNSAYFRGVVKQITGVNAYDFREFHQSQGFTESILTRLKKR